MTVSGAFHSDLMRDSVEPFKKALQKSEISDPVITVYSNVDGKSYRNADHIRHQLPKQVSLFPYYLNSNFIFWWLICLSMN